MLLTKDLLSTDNVLMTSVRPCFIARVEAVSYVAEAYPWSLYQASWSACWMYASGDILANHGWNFS